MRRSRLLSIAIVALVPLAFATPAHPAQNNKLLNGGFERSAFGNAPDAAGAADVWQPLLPEGWAFEGSAGLFDHADERASDDEARQANGGKRFVAISIPAGGKRAVCAGVDGVVPTQCADLGAFSGLKRTASRVYSVNPAWRNAAPVSVSGGTTYTLAFAASWSVVTEREGFFSAVRWLDAAGVPIGTATGPSRLATSVTSYLLGWKSYSGTVTAPGNAESAVVLLGATDDVWISSLRFDDVFFG